MGPGARAVLKRLRVDVGCVVACRSLPTILRSRPMSAPPMPRRGAISYGFGACPSVPAPPNISDLALPPGYALAIARAEPENNLFTIPRRPSPPCRPRPPLVAVANWQGDPSRPRPARPVRQPTASHICLLDADYDPGRVARDQGARLGHIHGSFGRGRTPRCWRSWDFRPARRGLDCGFQTARPRAMPPPIFDSADSLRALIPVLADPRFWRMAWGAGDAGPSPAAATAGRGT